MHIVLDCRSIHRHMGGIGRVALNLAKHIRRQNRGHRISILLGRDLPQELPLPGPDIVRVDAAMIDEPFEQLHLPSVLSQMAADAYLNTTFSVPAVKTTKYQISIVHDVVFEERPQWVEPRLCDYLKRWSRFAALHANHLITVSDHAKSRIEAVYGVDTRRVTRVYNGIDLAEFTSPSQNAIEQTLRRHSLRPPYLLYLGTLEPKKGTSELIAAFAHLVHAGFEGNLVLAGGKGGPPFDVEAIIAASNARDRILQLGYIDEREKTCLMCGASLFVYPSHYEGFGLPPLEAMALGVPCLVSNATSLPEIVGDAALTIDVRDIKGFSGAMQFALTDHDFRRRAADEGPRRASAFSWDKSAAQILDLCESLQAA